MSLKERKINMKTSSSKYIYAIGRRKSAVSRVRLFKGAGQNLVNDKKTDSSIYDRVFKLVDLFQKYYFTAKVTGGGNKGQSEAVVHGLARALVKLDVEKYRKILKKEGLLTRDPRERLRRMVGTGGKARRQKQSPKR